VRQDPNLRPGEEALAGSKYATRYTFPRLWGIPFKGIPSLGVLSRFRIISSNSSSRISKPWRCALVDCDESCLIQRRADREELSELSEKLRVAEEREAAFLVELSEIREQNELLEFRLLELEETSARRGSPDDTMDSGIVSPEPIQVNEKSFERAN